MLIKGLSRYNPINLLIFIVLSVILWLKTISLNDIPAIYIDEDPMPIYNWIHHFVTENNLYLASKIIALSLVILQGIFLIGILNQYNLIGIRSYLPGIIFILLTANLPDYQVLHPIFFANTFLLLAWNLLINAEQSQNSSGVYFNSSVLIGIATLFYPNYIYFVLVFIMSTSLNRVPRPREIGMLLLGIITVWYFYQSAFFLLTNHFETSGIASDLNFSIKEISEIKPTQHLFFIFFILMIILSSIYSTRLISTQKVQLRRNQKFLFLWFMVSLLIFLFTNSSFELIYVISIPTSILFSLFFSSTQYRWVKEILFILLAGISFINQVFPDIFLLLRG